MFSADAVKAQCNGMLPAHVYDKLYQTALDARGSVFVEVGTAHAAGTVSIASALRDSGRKGKVYTFEKILGGSREQFGDVDRNIEIIRSNLAAFGVEHIVELVIGDVSETAVAVPADAEIGLLMLDADGRIDRDIWLFHDRVAPGAPVIIDDVSSRVRLKPRGGGVFRVDQKHYISWLLIALLKEKKLIEEGEMASDTLFTRRGPAPASALGCEDVLKVYRELVFTMGYAPRRSMKRRAFDLVSSISPEAAQRLRRIVK